MIIQIALGILLAHVIALVLACLAGTASRTRSPYAHSANDWRPQPYEPFSIEHERFKARATQQSKRNAWLREDV